MLQSKVDELKKIAKEALQQEDSFKVEFGKRLSKFIKDNNSVYTDKLSFPTWCILQKDINTLQKLADAGFDLVDFKVKDSISAQLTKNGSCLLKTIVKNKCSDSEEFKKNFEKLHLLQYKNIIDLVDACQCGDYDRVEKLLNEGTPVDGRLPLYETTSLMTACKIGNIKIVELLLEFGANANAKDYSGETPLMWASYGNNVEILKLLVKKGAKVNVQDKVNGSTALIWWATNSEDNVLGAQFLVESGADIFAQVSEEKNFKGRNKIDITAEDHAFTSDNIEIYNYLHGLRLEEEAANKEQKRPYSRKSI